MSNCVFDLLIGGKRHMSCPWIYGESDPESLQKGVVLWAGILLWRDEGSGKPCICNCIVEREKSRQRKRSRIRLSRRSDGSSRQGRSSWQHLQLSATPGKSSSAQRRRRLISSRWNS